MLLPPASMECSCVWFREQGVELLCQLILSQLLMLFDTDILIYCIVTSYIHSQLASSMADNIEHWSISQNTDAFIFAASSRRLHIVWHLLHQHQSTNSRLYMRGVLQLQYWDRLLLPTHLLSIDYDHRLREILLIVECWLRCTLPFKHSLQPCSKDTLCSSDIPPCWRTP